jgi:hypothetical protein
LQIENTQTIVCPDRYSIETLEPESWANAEINKIPLSVWEDVYTNDKSVLEQCEQYMGAQYW